MTKLYLIVIGFLMSICFYSCSKKVTKVAIEQPQEQRQEFKEDSKIVNDEPLMVLPADKTDQIAVFDRVIQFDFDRSDIRPDMLPIMQESARIMRENPQIQIRCTGHTCRIGGDDYNLALGMLRAVSVRKWLVEHGVDGSRIDIATRGKLEPVDNVDLKKNRRVEIMTLFAKEGK